VKRIGAVVIAVGLVLGAVVIRDRIEGDDAGPAPSTRGVRLVCATQLAEVCAGLRSDDLEVVVEPAGRTADALAEVAEGDDPGLDLWLVDAAWPAVVEDNRRYADLGGEVLGGTSEVLARSPVVLMVSPGLVPVLEQRCGEVDWTCVGDTATRQQAVGIASPDRGGLPVLASAVAGRLGTTDYAVGDFEDPDFSAWFDRIATSGTRDLGRQTPLERGVAAPGYFAVVGTLEHEVVSLPRSRRRYEPIYPEPVITSDIVLAAVDGTAEAGLDRLGGAERVRSLLAGAGWRVEGQPLPDGADADLALPERSNLPAAGVLQRLRELWGA